MALTSVWQLNPVCLSDVATRTWPGVEAPAQADNEDVHAPAKPKALPLAWPDKTALVIAVLIAALCVVVWITTLASSGFMLYGRLDHALALWAAAAELGLALPAWFFLRFIDDIEGGPTYRREASHAQRIEPWFETVIQAGADTETEPNAGAEIVPFPGARVAPYSKKATERTSML